MKVQSGSYERPQAVRSRRRSLYWLLLGVVGIALALFVIWRARAQTTTTSKAPTAAVTQGDLSITVTGSGSVQPARAVDLPFQTAGQVKDVLVKAGDQVKAGQPLARLDSRDLELQVGQAEAGLKAAQAKLDTAQHGSATPQDLNQSKAQIAAAEAGLEKARTGNLTPADVQNAQAAVQAAADRLHQVQTGNTTAADIASAQAAVRNAEANLQKVRTGNTTPADIASAQASIRNAEANLQKVRTGNTTPADIANAQASVTSAEAKLASAKQGATADQVSAAQAKLQQAQESAQRTAATDSASKTSAQQAMNQAADSVRLAQTTYTSAYWDNQNAQNGIDPKTAKSFAAEKLDTPTQQQLYANALQTATLALSQAQSKLEQAKVTYDTAQKQEVTDNASAQSQVADAQTQLNVLLQGPKALDLVPLQAAVDQAKAQLTKLQQGGTAADVASAQAQVDQAKAGLAKLVQGPTAADLASAQAQVDQAKAGLAKLTQGGTASDVAIARDALTQSQAQLAKAQQGGTPADIAAAQSQVDQAHSAFDKLTAPAAEPDIATAQAGVAQAESQLAVAHLNLDRATLFAPFDGTVGAVPIVPGAIVSASTTAASIEDLSSLHIDINMSESDVGRIQPGQPVRLTYDALPGAVVAGTVVSVAPTSVVTQNVVTYLVQVKFDPGATPVKLGMSSTASIVVQQIKNAILVPNRAITTQGTNHSVQVQYGDRKLPVTVPIDTGATNGSQTEVTGCTDTGNQCLRVGDQLVLPSAAAPRSGTTGGNRGTTPTNPLLGGGRPGG